MTTGRRLSDSGSARGSSSQESAPGAVWLSGRLVLCRFALTQSQTDARTSQSRRRVYRLVEEAGEEGKWSRRLTSGGAGLWGRTGGGCDATKKDPAIEASGLPLPITTTLRSGRVLCWVVSDDRSIWNSLLIDLDWWRWSSPRLQVEASPTKRE